ncbi:MAG: FRG domain-containing protein [Rhodopirellula sp.]|nr:FRG domain-containing protein [Rhodopirellula sp.]
MWAYRGHGDDEFQLVPKSLRPSERASLFALAGQNVPEQIDNQSQVRAEALVIERFISHCDDSGLVVPGYGHILNETLKTNTQWVKVGSEVLGNWPHDPIVPSICLAQHHGLPTRFLDWSFSAFKAAHFAAADALAQKSARLSVWAISLPAFRKMRPISPSQGHYRVDVIVPPRCDNTYLRAQEGLFTLCRVNAFAEGDSVDLRPLDQQVESFDHSPPYSLNTLPVFYHVTLPSSEAVACLQGLEQESVNPAVLFPDYNGVVTAMKSRVHVSATDCPPKIE